MIDKAFVGSRARIHNHDALVLNKSLKLFTSHRTGIRPCLRPRCDDQSCNQRTEEAQPGG